MTSNFSDLLLQHFRKYFDYYDRDQIGRMQTNEIPSIVRVCGATPMEADLDSLKSLADPDGRGSCDFNGLCRALSAAFSHSVTQDQAIEAMAGFDGESRGFVSQGMLRYCLTSMGDNLTADDLNIFIEEMRSEMDMEGNLVIADVIYKMTPEMYR